MTANPYFQLIIMCLMIVNFFLSPRYHCTLLLASYSLDR